MNELIALSGKLGRLSGIAKGFFTFEKGTTPNTMRAIKAILSETDVPPKAQMLHQKYQIFLSAVKWKFGDVFDAIDFLSAYGKDNIFNGARLSTIAFIETPNSKGGECCSLPNRESQARCDCQLDDCLICGSSVSSYFSDDLHVPFTEPLPSDLTRSSSLWEVDGFDGLNRAPCAHAQSYRFFSFLAAHLRRHGYDPNSRSDVEKLRQNVITWWRDQQLKSGWTFPNGDFPPNDQDRSSSIQCDNGVKLTYMLYKTRHGEKETRVLTFCFIGQFELLV